MKQKILAIKQGRGKIISKPWDFEAMCRVDDFRNSEIVKGCLGAVFYLFEGTAATNDYLEKLSYDRMNELCKQVQRWYYEDIAELIKIQKNKTMENDDNGAGLRGLYAAMFKAWGILGNELGAQRPEFIFALLAGDKDSAKDAIKSMPSQVQAMYGL